MMGINLSVACAFKPRRKPTERALDKLSVALGSYADVGIHDNGYVYAQGSDIGSSGDQALREFIDKYATNYVVVEGDCDEGHYEEIVCPPGVEQWRAEVEWRKARIRDLVNEIITIVANEHKKGGA